MYRIILILAVVCLTAFATAPTSARAQVSIQTPGFGIAVGPNGGVGVRVGGVYGPPVGPPVYYGPGPRPVVYGPRPFVCPPNCPPRPGYYGPRPVIVVR